MTQTLKANKVTLADLEAQFGLVATHTPQFFSEWMEATGELTAEENQALERRSQNAFGAVDQQASENLINDC